MSSTSTTIEWTEKTWNPVRGCSLVSPGCTNCYAMGQAHRFSGEGKPYQGLTRKRVSLGPVWTGEVRTVPDALGDPLSWRRPTTVFVNSMSDLFHEDVGDAFVAAVFGIAVMSQSHTYQVLTKRAERMRAWFESMDRTTTIGGRGPAEVCVGAAIDLGVQPVACDADYEWPCENVWLGVSVEDRKHGLPRIEHLRATPAAVRFLSIEPLLEDLGSIDLTGISWVIVGGESGHGARRCDVRWIRSIVAQCREQGVAVFVKQLGAFVVDRNDAGFDGACEDSWPEMDPDDIEHDLDGTRDDYQGAPVRVHLRSAKGGDPEEWPLDLRVREMPGARS